MVYEFAGFRVKWLGLAVLVPALLLLGSIIGVSKADAACQLSADGTFRTCTDITYRTIETDEGPKDFKLTAFVPTPPNPLPPGETRSRNPAVVLVHGGGWRCRWDPVLLNDVGPHLARNDMAAFAIEYIPRENLPPGECPPAPESPSPPPPVHGPPPTYAPYYPTEAQNVGHAVQFLRAPANALAYDVEPSRIALLGSSAGGNLAAEWAMFWQGPLETGARVRAVVGVGGVYDLTDETLLPELRKGINDYLCTRNTEPVCLDWAAYASPWSHVDPTDPPMFFVHGSNDPLVPYGTQVANGKLRNALDQNGVPYGGQLFTGICHATQCYQVFGGIGLGGDFFPPNFEPTLNFLRSQLLPLPPP